MLCPGTRHLFPFAPLKPLCSPTQVLLCVHEIHGDQAGRIFLICVPVNISPFGRDPFLAQQNSQAPPRVFLKLLKIVASPSQS